MNNLERMLEEMGKLEKIQERKEVPNPLLEAIKEKSKEANEVLEKRRKKEKRLKFLLNAFPSAMLLLKGTPKMLSEREHGAQEFKHLSIETIAEMVSAAAEIAETTMKVMVVSAEEGYRFHEFLQKKSALAQDSWGSLMEHYAFVHDEDTQTSEDMRKALTEERRCTYILREDVKDLEKAAEKSLANNERLVEEIGRLGQVVNEYQLKHTEDQRGI